MSQCKYLKRPVFFIGLTLFMIMVLECHFDNALYAGRKTKHSKEADKNALSENLKTRPDDIRILNPLSKIYLEEGNYQKAFPLLLRIIEIDPRQVKAHYNLGMLYQIRALNDRAEQEFQIAARLDPEDPDIHFNLGNIYYKTGDYQKSIDQYLITTQINPMYKDAFYNLAGVYDDMNEVELALNAYQAVARINPNDSNVNQKIESLKQKMSLYQGPSDLKIPGTPKSIIRFDDHAVVISKEPKISYPVTDSRDFSAEGIDPLPFFANQEERSITKMNPSRAWDVQTEVRASQNKKRKDWTRYHQLGDEAYESGEFQPAMRMYEKALQVRKDPVLSVKIGQCLVKLIKNDQAIHYFEDAIANDPDYIEAYYLLGRSYLIESEFVKSRQVYEKMRPLNQLMAQKLYKLISLEEEVARKMSQE